MRSQGGSVEASESMTSSQTIETYLMDMDGVLVHQEQLIPGADQFVKRLQETGHRFLGLTTAMHERGYVLTERDPDYVVLGETRSYSQEAITRAIRLIIAGARFIATNPDPAGPSPAGPQPATGAVAALISKATGVEPYFVGKPNPLMMREALRSIDAHSESTVMIGDRMDTDIVAGIEAGLQTILVLSGITTRQEVNRFPFLPSRIVDSVADLVDSISEQQRPNGWPRPRRRAAQHPNADRVAGPARDERPPAQAAGAS